MTDTWNDAGTVFTSIKMTITDTNSAAGSKLIDISSSTGGSFSVSNEGNLTFSGYMDFTPITAPTWTEGRLYYDTDRKGLVIYNVESDISGNIMEEEWTPVWNDTGVQIDDGTPVYITGSNAGLPTVAPAIANGQRVTGLATHDIPDGERGYVTRGGFLSGPDYSSFNSGDTLYLSSTVAGEVTNVQPDFPAKVIELGNVIENLNPGSINVDLEHHGGPVAVVKSYTFASRAGASGEYYQAGYYEAPAADANLTQASTTQAYGTANASHAAHAFIVSAGDGATDGSDLVLTVTGTSITDAGVRTPADSEVVVADALVSGCPVDTYLETAKKWIGAITYTLSSTGGAAFAFSFNYGFAKYEDFNNTNVTFRGVEVVGLANATDAGFNVQLYHHTDQGWVYSAAAFVAGNTPIEDQNVTHGTDNDIIGGEHFAFKRTGANVAIAGASSEGLVMKVTTTVNNSISYMDSHLTVTAP
jgi:hypothetical protein